MAVTGRAGDEFIEEPGPGADGRVLGRRAGRAHLLHPPEPVLTGERLRERIVKEPVRSAAFQCPARRGHLGCHPGTTVGHDPMMPGPRRASSGAVAGRADPAGELSRRVQIAQTEPVTERVRVREIDDDEGRGWCGSRPPGQRVGGDLVAGADGPAIRAGHGRGRDRRGRVLRTLSFRFPARPAWGIPRPLSGPLALLRPVHWRDGRGIKAEEG